MFRVGSSCPAQEAQAVLASTTTTAGTFLRGQPVNGPIPPLTQSSEECPKEWSYRSKVRVLLPRLVSWGNQHKTPNWVLGSI